MRWLSPAPFLSSVSILAENWFFFYSRKMGLCRPSSETGLPNFPELRIALGHRTEDPSFIVWLLFPPYLLCRVFKPRTTQGPRATSPRSNRVGRASFGGVAAAWAAMLQQTPEFSWMKAASERAMDRGACESDSTQKLSRCETGGRRKAPEDFMGTSFMLCQGRSW
ncbi:uncharacterized protein B0H64DRAFT_53278 [Chaetomium fimeti]|uniref:Uncharacterized protein n=1 Tax=Chaetomium fimeti TaxID=1854472 RepID=A0AAE0H613_9PEZI|nr:hypothetical protein B0H64DRAFT_53278 [Chaetomium fimeti]